MCYVEASAHPDDEFEAAVSLLASLQIDVPADKNTFFDPFLARRTGEGKGTNQKRFSGKKEDMH